jgi:two-component system sensor histidine kinase DesK
MPAPAEASPAPAAARAGASPAPGTRVPGTAPTGTPSPQAAATGTPSSQATATAASSHHAGACGDHHQSRATATGASSPQAIPTGPPFPQTSITEAATAAADPFADELGEDLAGSLQRRRRVTQVLLAGLLITPAATTVATQGFTGRAVFLVPASAVLTVLAELLAFAPLPVTGWRRRWQPFLLTALVALGVAIFAVGRANWLMALAIAAGALGKFATSRRLALTGTGGCAAVGLGLTAGFHLGYGAVLGAALVPALAGFLASAGERRNALIRRLQQTRAELARMAVAEERLRIARDLHDLLGHSLSLIALKAELAGRLLPADPDRAAREVFDLEAVARRSLSEVRQAVTGYRQPGLAAELAAARRMLASAGVDCRVAVPAAYSLPPAADALLAWAVREGATNIVRHAAARQAVISIRVTATLASAELTDDGAGPGAGATLTTGCGQIWQAAGAATAPGPAGHAGGTGLAGLSERAAGLGGTILAGPGERRGFRLRVEIPLTASPGCPRGDGAAGSRALRAGGQAG